jgi:hypothetical protein
MELVRRIMCPPLPLDDLHGVAAARPEWARVSTALKNTPPGRAKLKGAMTPELEIELRTTVASLPVKTFCQELLIMAFLPMLRLAKQAAIHGCLAAMEEGEVLPSRLVDPGQVESENGAVDRGDGRSSGEVTFTADRLPRLTRVARLASSPVTFTACFSRARSATAPSHPKGRDRQASVPPPLQGDLSADFQKSVGGQVEPIRHP